MSVPGVFQTEALSVHSVPTPQGPLSSGRLGSEAQVASRRLELEPTSLLSSVAHIPSAVAVAVGGGWCSACHRALPGCVRSAVTLREVALWSKSLPKPVRSKLPLETVVSWRRG